uniref:homeobox-DDT domain protein RLT1 isoform X2 n=1 Tax=Erigeron canadensis TaxID=72917 RepID=UPI001CB88E57|nr:homeobox-DDT domain protein RLT1 isoform X2 [Erigeron canadensis]
MEDPQVVHADENKAITDKKPKRTVKTPDQIAALENFYNEHKYPSEAMKAKFAESIRLTEKQVSGWFCHRRLKDKKLPNDEGQAQGKQDLSSGVIQDRGSGLRQDSCGSTKQGDNKHFDPKEVESRRFTTEGLLPIELRFDHGNQHNSMMEMDDDTSSGSSSPLKDNFHLQNVDCLVRSKYPTHKDVNSVKSKPGPSGYLKVRGQAENAAIIAVRRQLGRHYREDGPPLGTEFDTLPPGAFENPVTFPVNQPYYVGDPTALHPPDSSKTFQLPSASKMLERYNPKNYHPLDLDESGFEIRHASRHYEKHANNQYKQTPHFSKHIRSQSGRSSQMEVNGGSDEEVSVHGHKEIFETRIKHGPGVRRAESQSNRSRVGYGINIDVMQVQNYPRSHHSGPSKVNYRDNIDHLTSDLNVKRGEYVDFEDKGIYRRTPKDDLFDGERRGTDEYSKLVSVKIHPGNEMQG